MTYTARMLISFQDPAAEEFFTRLHKGETLWVRYRRGNRTGAIGKASLSSENQWNPSKPWGIHLATSKNAHNYAVFIDVAFDKGRGAKLVYMYGIEVEWLDGYDGPIVYKSPTRKKVAVVPKDRLGKEIKVGDFGSCVLSHAVFSGPALYFGKITRITEYGKVYIRTIPLSESEKPVEQKLNKNSDFVIIDDTLMSDLMMKRLSL